MDGPHSTPTLTIRPYHDHDLPALVALLNAARPESPTTEEDLRTFDAQREPHEILVRSLLVRGTDVVGVGEYGTPRFNPDPELLQLNLFLHPDVLGEGHEEVLLRHLQRGIEPHAPRALVTGTREDRWELAFWQRHGFREVDRMFGSTLDVTRFDPTPFERFEERSRAAGIRIVTLTELPLDDEAFQRRLYDAVIEMLHDVPTAHPFNPWPFATWQQRFLGSPQFMRESYFVALDGDTIAGVSELRRSTLPETIQTGLTGVRRDWRRKGIAQTLKLAATRYARDHGHRFVRTTNHSVNRPMLAINEAMGYVKEPAWVNLEKHLR